MNGGGKKCKQTHLPKNALAGKEGQKKGRGRRVGAFCLLSARFIFKPRVTIKRAAKKRKARKCYFICNILDDGGRGGGGMTQSRRQSAKKEEKERKTG